MDYKVKFLMKVKELDDETNDIGEFITEDGFVFVAELMDSNVNDLVPDKEYDVRVFFYGHELDGVFDNEEEFHKVNPTMDKESFIPIGAFPANEDDKDWRPSPMNYINSIVDEVIPEGALGQEPEMLLFGAKVGDTKLDQCFYFPDVERKPILKVGQIISGCYWAELHFIEPVEGEVN